MSILVEETYRRTRVFVYTMEAGDTDVEIIIDNGASDENPTTEVWWITYVTDDSGVTKSTVGLTGTYNKSTGKLTLANGGSFTFADGDVLTVICANYTID